MVSSMNINVEKIVEEVIGCKWSLHILRLISRGYNRPSMILRASGGLSAKVLNERLRKLCSFGILNRIVLGEKPPIRVEYHFTHLGKSFLKIIDDIDRIESKFERGNNTQAIGR